MPSHFSPSHNINMEISLIGICFWARCFQQLLCIHACHYWLTKAPHIIMILPDSCIIILYFKHHVWCRFGYCAAYTKIESHVVGRSAMPTCLHVYAKESESFIFFFFLSFILFLLHKCCVYVRACVHLHRTEKIVNVEHVRCQNFVWNYKRTNLFSY